MILFLNKRDLFMEKIKKYEIKDSPGFTDAQPRGDMSDDEYYNYGYEYFKGKFMRRKGDPDKQVYTHLTCATDTENVKTVFDSCKQIIMKKNLEAAGFIA